jgi:hypothetical protein
MKISRDFFEKKNPQNFHLQASGCTIRHMERAPTSTKTAANIAAPGWRTSSTDMVDENPTYYSVEKIHYYDYYCSYFIFL